MANPNNRQNRKQRRATGTGKKKRNNQPRNQNRSNSNPQHQPQQQWEQEQPQPRFNPNPAPTNYFPGGYGNQQQQPAQPNNGAYGNQHGAPGSVNDFDFTGNFPAEAVTDPEPVIEEYYEDDEEDAWEEDAPQLKDFSKMLPASTLGIYAQALMLSEELGPIAQGFDSENMSSQSMEAMHKSVEKAQEMVLENAEDRAEMQEFLESLSLNDGIAFIMEKFAEILESLGN
jgi:hypothetical protein